MDKFLPQYYLCLMDTASLLEKHDRILYSDMIDPLLSGSARSIYSGEEGVIISFEGGTCFIALLDKTKAREIADRIPRSTECVMIHEKEMVSEIKQLGFELEEECALYVYDRKEPVRIKGEHEIVTLTREHLDLVISHYHLFTDAAYFTERLEGGVFRGIMAGSEIAGFIACHREGAMGMLEIFPEYRRRGLGYELEGAYINELLLSGHTPYCNVIEGNISSASLQKRLGLVPADGISDWYRRDLSL